MKLIHSLSLTFAIAAIAVPGGVVAQDSPHQHPTDVAAPAVTTSNAMPDKPNPDMASMDAQMQAMKKMHDKMIAAKTPAQRNALMAEHMKLMQDSMKMMNEMSAGGMEGMDMMNAMPSSEMKSMKDMKGMEGMKCDDMAAHHQMMGKRMEKRMEMMQAMMQMMMDCLPTNTTK